MFMHISDLQLDIVRSANGIFNLEHSQNEIPLFDPMFAEIGL